MLLPIVLSFVFDFAFVSTFDAFGPRGLDLLQGYLLIRNPGKFELIVLSQMIHASLLTQCG